MKKIISLLIITASATFFAFQKTEPTVGLEIGNKAPELKLPGVDGDRKSVV